MECEVCHKHIKEGTTDEYAYDAYGVCYACLVM